MKNKLSQNTQDNHLIQLKQLKQSDIKPLSIKWHKEQEQICPILKQVINQNDVVIDHLHKKESEEASPDGKGLCRGAIHRQANSLEGRILKSFIRSGCHKFITLPEFLRNLADYLEDNRSIEGLIHPSEAPKKRKLTKRSYNKLKKKVVSRKKFPTYTGNLTKPLQALYTEFSIEPEFY